MKVSIITVCFNSEGTIEDTIKSIELQSYSNIEYIIIDGGSNDSTNEIIKKYAKVCSIHLSEPDDGLYDAMNKGIRLATGDVVGILNSDDVLASSTTIEKIVNEFTKDVDAVYGDIVYYNSNLTKKVRHYSSDNFSFSNFANGRMPAHPSFYVRRSCYKIVGRYRTDFKIASDFDMLLRLFLIDGFFAKYVKDVFVNMRVGGVSTSGIKANIDLNKEILLSLKESGIKSNWFKILSKYPKKLLEYIVK